MSKQERRDFYLRLVDILREPQAGSYSLGTIYKKTHEVMQAYNAKFSPSKNESQIAAGLKFMASRNIVRQTKRYDGAFWSLVHRADVNGFLDSL